MQRSVFLKARFRYTKAIIREIREIRVIRDSDKHADMAPAGSIFQSPKSAITRDSDNKKTPTPNPTN